MSLKNFVAGFLLLLATTWTAVGQDRSLTGCALIDVTHPPLFIQYEDKLESKIRLRLRNNCTCAILVETDDHYPTQGKRLPQGGARIESVLNASEGIRLPLHYLVQSKPEGVLRRAYGWGDSVFIYEIPAGQSITFTVPVNHFKGRVNIAVPFGYSWEAKSSINTSAGGVAHLVYFMFQDLPSDALNGQQK